MTPWEWWAETLAPGQEPCGEYDVAAEPTREAIIAAALRETRRGERFVIIEARSSTAMKYEGADIVPFVRTRNREILTNAPQPLSQGSSNVIR